MPSPAPPSPAAGRFPRLRRPFQLALLVGLWAVGDALARASRLPIPGGVVGLGLLLALIASGALRLESVRDGAGWLLGELLLFFVPAVVAAVDHPELWSVLGLKVLVVILAGSAAVMGVTGAVVDLGARLGVDRAEDSHGAV